MVVLNYYEILTYVDVGCQKRLQVEKDQTQFSQNFHSGLFDPSGGLPDRFRKKSSSGGVD